MNQEIDHVIDRRHPRRKSDPEVRKALKKQQLARLAAKGTPEYPALYAAQPEQVRKAAEYGAERKIRRDLKEAAKVRAIVEAAEGAKVFEGADVFKGAAAPTKTGEK
ncbi:hypothetical protein LCGC14_2138450 [marine sediment metagenome]|uniref:Uncharacterized protein n=1 Tax=marine sediment metagenome TaxID=412755 RepID=A0A0F9ELD0_9ZZZZ